MDKTVLKLRMREALDQVLEGLTTLKTLTLEAVTSDEMSEEDQLQLLKAVKLYRVDIEIFQTIRDKI